MFHRKQAFESIEVLQLLSTDKEPKHPSLNYWHFEEYLNYLLCANRSYGAPKSKYNTLFIMVGFSIQAF